MYTVICYIISIFLAYCCFKKQAQEEISHTCQEVIKCTRTPRSTVAAQAMLRHVETERDTALSDLRRMTTERDSLREQMKV